MIVELLAENRPFHSEFQMERFIVIGAGRTPWGMYCQALRELRTRFDALKLDYASEARLDLDLGDLQAKAKRAKGRDAKRNALDRAEKVMRIEGIRANRIDREREFAWFLGVARKLKAALGELTPERRVQLEEDLWAVRLREQAAADTQAHGRVMLGTWQAIANLPKRLKDPIVADIVNRQKLLVDEWLARDPGIPEPELVPAAEVRALIAGAR